LRVIGKKVIMTTGLLEGIGVVKRALLVFSTTRQAQYRPRER